MLDELAGSADILEPCKADLSNDRTELARRGRDTVRGRTITSREGLSGDDESRGVGTKVLEKVGHASNTISAVNPWYG